MSRFSRENRQFNLTKLSGERYVTFAFTYRLKFHSKYSTLSFADFSRWNKPLYRTFYPQRHNFSESFGRLTLLITPERTSSAPMSTFESTFRSVIFCKSFHDACVCVCVCTSLACIVSQRTFWIEARREKIDLKEYQSIEISKEWFFYDGEKLPTRYTYDNVLFNECDSWPRERGILRTYRYAQRRCYRVDIVTRNVLQVCTCNTLTLYASRVIISRCRCTWFINVSWR